MKMNFHNPNNSYLTYNTHPFDSTSASSNQIPGHDKTYHRNHKKGKHVISPYNNKFIAIVGLLGSPTGIDKSVKRPKEVILSPPQEGSCYVHEDSDERSNIKLRRCDCTLCICNTGKKSRSKQSKYVQVQLDNAMKDVETNTLEEKPQLSSARNQFKKLKNIYQNDLDVWNVLQPSVVSNERKTDVAVDTSQDEETDSLTSGNTKIFKQASISVEKANNGKIKCKYVINGKHCYRASKAGKKWKIEIYSNTCQDADPKEQDNTERQSNEKVDDQRSSNKKLLDRYIEEGIVKRVCRQLEKQSGSSSSGTSSEEINMSLRKDNNTDNVTHSLPVIELFPKTPSMGQKPSTYYTSVQSPLVSKQTSNNKQWPLISKNIVRNSSDLRYASGQLTSGVVPNELRAYIYTDTDVSKPKKKTSSNKVQQNVNENSAPLFDFKKSPTSLEKVHGVTVFALPYTESGDMMNKLIQGNTNGTEKTLTSLLKNINCDAHCETVNLIKILQEKIDAYEKGCPSNCEAVAAVKELQKKVEELQNQKPNIEKEMKDGITDKPSLFDEVSATNQDGMIDEEGSRKDVSSQTSDLNEKTDAELSIEDIKKIESDLDDYSGSSEKIIKGDIIKDGSSNDSVVPKSSVPKTCPSTCHDEAFIKVIHDRIKKYIKSCPSSCYNSSLIKVLQNKIEELEKAIPNYDIHSKPIVSEETFGLSQLFDGDQSKQLLLGHIPGANEQFRRVTISDAEKNLLNHTADIFGTSITTEKIKTRKPTPYLYYQFAPSITLISNEKEATSSQTPNFPFESYNLGEENREAPASPNVSTKHSCCKDDPAFKQLQQQVESLESNLPNESKYTTVAEDLPLPVSQEIQTENDEIPKKSCCQNDSFIKALKERIKQYDAGCAMKCNDNPVIKELQKKVESLEKVFPAALKRPSPTSSISLHISQKEEPDTKSKTGSRKGGSLGTLKTEMDSKSSRQGESKKATSLSALFNEFEPLATSSKIDEIGLNEFGELEKLNAEIKICEKKSNTSLCKITTLEAIPENTTATTKGNDQNSCLRRCNCCSCSNAMLDRKNAELLDPDAKMISPAKNEISKNKDDTVEPSNSQNDKSVGTLEVETKNDGSNTSKADMKSSSEVQTDNPVEEVYRRLSSKKSIGSSTDENAATKSTKVTETDKPPTSEAQTAPVEPIPSKTETIDSADKPLQENETDDSPHIKLETPTKKRSPSKIPVLKAGKCTGATCKQESEPCGINICKKRHHTNIPRIFKPGGFPSKPPSPVFNKKYDSLRSKLKPNPLKTIFSNKCVNKSDCCNPNTIKKLENKIDALERVLPYGVDKLASIQDQFEEWRKSGAPDFCEAIKDLHTKVDALEKNYGTKPSKARSTKLCPDIIGKLQDKVERHKSKSGLKGYQSHIPRANTSGGIYKVEVQEHENPIEQMYKFAEKQNYYPNIEQQSQVRPSKSQKLKLFLRKKFKHSEILSNQSSMYSETSSCSIVRMGTSKDDFDFPVYSGTDRFDVLDGQQQQKLLEELGMQRNELRELKSLLQGHIKHVEKSGKYKNIIDNTTILHRAMVYENYSKPYENSFETPNNALLDVEPYKHDFEEPGNKSPLTLIPYKSNKSSQTNFEKSNSKIKTIMPYKENKSSQTNFGSNKLLASLSRKKLCAQKVKSQSCPDCHKTKKYKVKEHSKSEIIQSPEEKKKTPKRRKRKKLWLLMLCKFCFCR